MNKYIITLAASMALVWSCGKKIQETSPIRKDITESVFASGTLEADDTYNLTAQTDGYITALYFKEGDIVAKGKLLAKVENNDDAINIKKAEDLLNVSVRNTEASAPQLRQAEKNIGFAKTKMEQDRATADRYKALWESNSIAKMDYDNMELNYQSSKTNYEVALENYKSLKDNATEKVISNKAQKDLNILAAQKNIIKAVAGGKVYELSKKVGDFVRRGETIAVIGSATNIYAKLNVDEGSIGKIKTGLETDIQLNTQKDKVYKGSVYEIAPSYDAASQSFIVKVKFTDPLDFNIIKTQLQSNILIGSRQNVLLIPRNYLDLSNTVQLKGAKEPTKVKTRMYSTEYVEIIEGITEKDILVTEKLGGKSSSTSSESPIGPK
jgi:HlyD family secretion protein